MSVAFHGIVKEANPAMDIDLIDLIFQTGIFLLLLSGHPRFHLFHKMTDHAWVMVLATVLNSVSILVVMIPLAFVETTDIPYALSYAHPFLFVVHVLVGIIAWALAILISARWLATGNVRKCFKKRTMNLAFGFWTASFALGTATYLIHYLPISTL